MRYLNNKIGSVIEFADQVAVVHCRSNLFLGELLCFQNPESLTRGFVFNIEGSVFKVPLVYGDESRVSIGDRVFRTNKLVQTRCGFGVLGQVINPLGDSIIYAAKSYLDTVLDRLFNTFWLNVEFSAPGIVSRSPVSVPFFTGLASVDCFFPIGCGQRELIIGDHGSGKTSLAITAIINQSTINNRICRVWNDLLVYSDPYSLFFPCIYVAIGSKRSEIIRIQEVLSEKHAWHYTCIVFTGSDEYAALQYLAPFAGCAIGEWFMRNGYNAVVVYDDLSNHATAYRQMALLLRRPPGREAYPGDIFFLHSRLLERSAQLVTGGSLTSLPIIRTMGNDMSGYIPTNVISITDGQLFLLITLMNKGVKPAVDLSLSVSRVGSAAQVKAMAAVSKRVKGFYALYKMYFGVSQLGSDDPEANLHVNRGAKILEFFKQDVYETYPIFQQIFSLFMFTLEYSDAVTADFARAFFFFLKSDILARSYLSKTSRLSFFFDKSYTYALSSLSLIFSLDIINNDVQMLAEAYSGVFESYVLRFYTAKTLKTLTSAVSWW